MTTTPALIDILSLIQQKANIALVGRPTRHHNQGLEYHSNCPFCKTGHDRFCMWPEVGRFYCRVCGKFGDCISFLRELEDISFREACDVLGIDHRYPEEWKPTVLPLFMTRNEPPNKIWMEAAEMFCWRAQRYLFSPGGERGLNYLHGRGLNDATIKRARLGFCPDWYGENIANWGLSSIQTDTEEELIKIPEGIIIPWIVENAIWKLSVRRPNKSYFQITGSSDALYGIDDLLPDRPVFLFESEFDKLSAEQEAGDLATMIATGGASKGQTTPMRHKLKQASHCLIGFDNDAAGNEGAIYWLKMPHTIRWTPWAHDINEFLQQQPSSVRMWAEMGIKAATIELQAPEKPQPIVTPIATPVVLTPSKPHRDAIQTYVELNPWTTLGDRGLPKFCSVCRKEQAVWWGVGVTPFCQHCFEQVGYLQPYHTR